MSSLKKLGSNTNNVSLGGTLGNTTISGSNPWTISSGGDGDFYDLHDKCLDLEKLETFNKEKREMLFNLFMKFIESNLEPQKSVLYNTLEPYNVIVDKSKLERKVKIDAILNKKESEDE
jgi:hypothetical protein